MWKDAFNYWKTNYFFIKHELANLVFLGPLHGSVLQPHSDGRWVPHGATAPSFCQIYVGDRTRCFFLPVPTLSTRALASPAFPRASHGIFNWISYFKFNIHPTKSTSLFPISFIGTTFHPVISVWNLKVILYFSLFLHAHPPHPVNH